MWLESRHLAPVIIDALRDTKPCQACGKTLVKAHACHVVRQIAIIRALNQTDRLAEDVAQGKPVAPMPPKPDKTGRFLTQASEYVTHQPRPKAFDLFMLFIQAVIVLMVPPPVHTAKVPKGVTLLFVGALRLDAAERSIQTDGDSASFTSVPSAKAEGPEEPVGEPTKLGGPPDTPPGLAPVHDPRGHGSGLNGYSHSPDLA